MILAIVGIVVVGGVAVAAYLDRARLKSKLDAAETSVLGQLLRAEASVKNKVKAAVLTALINSKQRIGSLEKDVQLEVVKELDKFWAEVRSHL